MTRVIATDHPLTTPQQETLAALLDTVLPASDDGRMPSAAEFDFVGFLQETSEALVPVLVEAVDHFDPGFAGLDAAERQAVVEAFSVERPELFRPLLQQIYACYYQNDRVLIAIGLAGGPPFPRGNTVEAGDLSLLDPVVAKNKTYRQ